jgi:hypothetical protein
MATTASPQNNNNGIGFAGLLTVLFIGLKLTNYVTWSWVWVLSPMWIPLTIVLGFGAIAILVAYFLSK